MSWPRRVLWPGSTVRSSVGTVLLVHRSAHATTTIRTSLHGDIIGTTSKCLRARRPVCSLPHKWRHRSTRRQRHRGRRGQAVTQPLHLGPVDADGKDVGTQCVERECGDVDGQGNCLTLPDFEVGWPANIECNLPLERAPLIWSLQDVNRVSVGILEYHFDGVLLVRGSPRLGDQEVDVLTEEFKVSDSDGRSARDKLRDEVEAAMDDPNQWADEPLPGPARRSEKRQRAAMISIRLSSEELETVQAEAAARGLTVSRYVRDRALEPALSVSVHKAHCVVANRTSHSLMNVVIGHQTGSPVVAEVLGPTLRLTGIA
jgi:hypothetical protein